MSSWILVSLFTFYSFTFVHGQSIKSNKWIVDESLSICRCLQKSSLMYYKKSGMMVDTEALEV